MKNISGSIRPQFKRTELARIGHHNKENHHD